ncbi:MAG: hypothetical protein KAX38_00300, partial [Candidatus Krumholzibacteria bacterium]|nr:hypothetical protein [Candidatus Krumholzibacteria bacterium]
MERLKRRLFCPEGIILSGFLLIVLVGLSMASDETMAPDNWVYPALRKFELLGLVHLDPTTPYSRREIESCLNRILSGLNEEKIELSKRQRFLLDRLRKEYQGKSSKPARREDPPVYYYREGNRFFAVDFSVGGAFM